MSDIDETVRLARQHAPAAIQALAETVADPKASRSTRNRAAGLILEAAGYVKTFATPGSGPEATERTE